MGVRYLAPGELPARRADHPARPGDGVRVAYAIGRPVGGAVLRNRVRRRLRAVVAEFDRNDGLLEPGAYLIAAGREAADLPFETLRADVRRAIDRVHRREPVTSGNAT